MLTAGYRPALVTAPCCKNPVLLVVGPAPNGNGEYISEVPCSCKSCDHEFTEQEMDRFFDLEPASLPSDTAQEMLDLISRPERWGKLLLPVGRNERRAWLAPRFDGGYRVFLHINDPTKYIDFEDEFHVMLAGYLPAESEV